MYEISYGSKYDKNLGTKEIAAKVRADIKSAVKTGDLPTARYSVTMDRFSGGSSIDIKVSDVQSDGFRLFNEERLAFDRANPHDFTRLPRYSGAATALLAKLKRMLMAYNFDGSEIQVDYFHVKFYGGVDFSHEYESARRAIESQRTPHRTTVKAHGLTWQISTVTVDGRQETMVFYRDPMGDLSDEIITEYGDGSHETATARLLSWSADGIIKLIKSRMQAYPFGYVELLHDLEASKNSLV